MDALFRIQGFLVFVSMIFLNAFVDLGHKIIIQNTVFKLYSGQEQVILTAIVNALILLPFIFLFSPSGFLSDRYRKETVMRYSAWVAFVAAILITIAYSAGNFWAAFALTLLLGIQSAIYSPAKYGFIRQLVGVNLLGSANALVQSITIVAILSGTFVFSIAFESLLNNIVLNSPADAISQLQPIGYGLIGLTAIEVLLAYRLPRITREQPDKRFEIRAYATGRYLGENLRTLKQSRVIWLSIIGLSMFWGISQVVLAAFPAYAKATLGISNTIVIQGVLAASGVGIILGSLIAGKMSRNHIETGLVPVGAIGIAMVLFALTTLNTQIAMVVCFLLLGLFGGMFIVPLNSLIQYHAAEQEMGKVLAGNNWIQNVTMTLFLVVTVVFALLGLDSIGLFYMLIVVAVAGTVFTIVQLPHSLARVVLNFVLKKRYRLNVEGFENLPRTGGVLLLGNHISWIDWAIIQIACPRPIRFVMLRSIYNKPLIKYLFRAFGAIPIERGHSQRALQQVNQLLEDGQVVCLFPEGAISEDGELAEFKTGYERAIAGLDVPIIPFYLDGLWGSQFSKSDFKQKSPQSGVFTRTISVTFNSPMPATTKAADLRSVVSIMAEERNL